MTTKRYIPLTDKLCCSEANNVLTENITNLIFPDGTEWRVCSQELRIGTQQAPEQPKTGSNGTFLLKHKRTLQKLR